MIYLTFPAGQQLRLILSISFLMSIVTPSFTVQQFEFDTLGSTARLQCLSPITILTFTVRFDGQQHPPSLAPANHRPACARCTSSPPHYLLPSPPTVHWIQDNFVFGQNSKSLLVFRNGPVRSFGTFYATFEKQNGDFLIPSVKKVDLKNRKNEKMAQNGQFWAYFGVFE